MADQRTELIHEIERLFRQIAWQSRHHLARRLQTFGLTVPQYLVLKTIGELGPHATMSEVGEALQVPASSMTSIVDRLVRDGLVERGDLPHDRRAVVATITPAGAELVATVEGASLADLTKMLDGFTVSDLNDFVRVLTHFWAGIERLTDAETSPPAVPSSRR